ncbi:ribonuclease H-like domain-containing protein [Tanacetum coccineum]
MIWVSTSKALPFTFVVLVVSTSLKGLFVRFLGRAVVNNIFCFVIFRIFSLRSPLVFKRDEEEPYLIEDVIENGNSFKPAAQTTTNVDGTSTTLIPGPLTTEEKVQKKNDVKARSMLLMALLNEHLMTFNQYKDAKPLFAAIQTRFGGNEATKKTRKTFLKQMYEKFSAPSTESLDSIFNRLQKIVSQLAILGENISQEDLNLKFLRSLPSEWNTHVVVWRNKPDLDTMSFDDLYNNFKIVEQDIKGTTCSSSSSSSKNMAFVSSPSSTNEVNTAYGVSTANTQVSPASTQVSTTSTQVSTANLSDDTVYAFLAISIAEHEDKKFFHKTSRKITINGSDTAGYDKSKVECFNCHKMGYFARECIGHRNQDSGNRNQESSRSTVNVEETSSKAMVAIDGASFDWSYMADEEVPTNMALIAFLGSEVYNDKTCSKACLKRFETLKTQLDDLRIEFNKSEFNLATYKKGLASVEEQLVFYKKNEVFFCEQLVVLKRDISYKDSEISMLKSELEKLRQEKESNQLKIENFDNASKSLYKLIGSQITDKKEFQQPEFEGYRPKTSKNVSEDTSNEVRESLDAPMVEKLLSDDKLEKKIVFPTVVKIEFFRPKQQEKPVKYAEMYSFDHVQADCNYHQRKRVVSGNNYTRGHPQKEDQGYVDSGCSRHMTGNIDAGKKDDEGVNKESRIDDQERLENSTQDVNTAGPSINTASTNDNTGSLNINTVSPTVTTAPLEAIHVDFFGDETEIDMSNITTIYLVPSNPNTRIHKDHSLDHVIGDVQSGVQTRRMTKTTNEQGFISAVYEGKTHEDLYTCLFACFISQEEPKKVWTLVDLPHGKRAIGTKWVYKNKNDERVARIEAIRLFLAYASFKDFVVYQIDVKSAFLFGKIEEEVYVCQPPGFEDPEFPDKDYNVEKALYGLHQAPRACSRLQVTQKDDGLFISQDKYVDEILKKFGFSTVKTTSTPMETSKPLMKDENAEDVDVHLYRSINGSLMYLTSSRPDIMFVVCALQDPNRKSTTGGCQFLGSRLISWQCKKQTIVANSTTEAEYVAAASCCGQFWETATARTLDNGEIELTATIDGKVKMFTE